MIFKKKALSFALVAGLALGCSPQAMAIESKKAEQNGWAIITGLTTGVAMGCKITDLFTDPMSYAVKSVVVSLGSLGSSYLLSFITGSNREELVPSFQVATSVGIILGVLALAHNPTIVTVS